MRQELEVVEPSARPLIEERMRQAEQEVAILQKACAACQADGNLSPAATAAEIARENESLARELEEWEHWLAATRDWMAQLPEGAAQSGESSGMREARAWEWEWPVEVSAMSDFQVVLNANQVIG